MNSQFERMPPEAALHRVATKSIPECLERSITVRRGAISMVVRLGQFQNHNKPCVADLTWIPGFDLYFFGNLLDYSNCLNRVTLFTIITSDSGHRRRRHRLSHGFPCRIGRGAGAAAVDQTIAAAAILLRRCCFAFIIIFSKCDRRRRRRGGKGGGAVGRRGGRRFRRHRRGFRGTVYVIFRRLVPLLLLLLLLLGLFLRGTIFTTVFFTVFLRHHCQIPVQVGG